jgi:hypothetical protein
MKRYLNTFVFVLFSICIFSSCVKDNSPTQGQIMAAKLRNDIAGTTINTVYVYDFSSGALRAQGTGIQINGDGTINVINGGSNPTNVAFNLQSLITYDFATGYLYLYF